MAAPYLPGAVSRNVGLKNANEPGLVSHLAFWQVAPFVT